MAERSKTVLAATAANKIIELRAQCEDEIKHAPESIRARFAEKENKLLLGLDATVRAYCEGNLRTHYELVEGEQKGKVKP